MPDSTLSTLDKIRIKIRRITKTPSQSQMTDADIDTYVNTFILYDIPQHFQLFSLRKTIDFYTAPYVDRYTTVNVPATSPLYNFKNTVTNVTNTIRIDGAPAILIRDNREFFARNPIQQQISVFARGDGISTAFTTTLLFKPILHGSVTISSIDANGLAISLRDEPNAGTTITGTLVDTETLVVRGSINYITGQMIINFGIAPANRESVTASFCAYIPSTPREILYYQDAFIVRPIPDRVYKVTIEVDVRPTELLNGNDIPDIAQWWQYIAYGAAKKIFEDKSDIASVNVIMQEFKHQEILVGRKTIRSLAEQRTATIYSDPFFKD